MALTFPTEQKELEAFIDRRHPSYNARLNHWRFCRATYDGGRDWFKDNIHKYMKEGDSEYKDRVTRAYRFNHTREVVNLTTKYIFKTDIARNDKDAPKSVRKFWKKAALNSTAIDGLMRRVCDLTSIYGRVWMIVDSIGGNGSAISIADQKSGNAKIYAYTVTPEDMLDYSWDDSGELNWVMYRVAHRDDSDPIASKGDITTRYVVMTKDEWAILEEVENKTKSVGRPVRNIQIIDRGVNQLGELAVYPIDERDSDDLYDVPSLISDIAYLDRAVANYLSNIDAIIQDQAFSQLVMPSQGIEAGSDSYKKLVEMGTKRIFTYDGESTKGPEYISPDPRQASMIMDMVNKIINEIYHTIGLAGERTKQDNSVGIDNSSGVAKAYDFERVNSLLAHKADVLDRAENRLVYFVAKYAGEELKKDEDGEYQDLINYPDNFDVRSLTDEFSIAQALALLEAPDEVRRQQMNILVNKMFPRGSDEDFTKMEKDIKSWPPKIDPLVAASPTGAKTSSPTRKSRQGQVTKTTK